MIAASITGLDRLGQRLLARARALSRARRIGQSLPPDAVWRRPDLIWPFLEQG